MTHIRSGLKLGKESVLGVVVSAIICYRMDKLRGIRH